MFAVNSEQGVRPGRWVLLGYRDMIAILAGGSGLGSLDWRRSSPIVKTRHENGCFIATTESGSEYILDPKNFGLSSVTSGIVVGLELHGKSVDLILDQERALTLLGALNGD